MSEDNEKKNPVIVLVGGGTGGSVSPLLAVAQEIKEGHPDAQFFFIGGKFGPERVMAEGEGIKFFSIEAGKFRRYFSFQNFLTPFLVITAFIQSLHILFKIKPACVFGAGSFIQVPVCWASWILGIPVVLHQQDIHPSLSNKLCAPMAKKITVTFEKSLYDFPQSLSILKMNNHSKTEWTGNPSRIGAQVPAREESLRFFGLDLQLSTILIMGGGTGASALNKLVEASILEFQKVVNVIHITGKGKGQSRSNVHYYATEFLAEMEYAYGASDVVVSRAGVSSLAELSVLGKPSIIIPLPKSHQEENAELVRLFEAGLVADQESITPENFISGIRKLLLNKDLLDKISANIKNIMPHGAQEKIAKIITDVVYGRK